MSKRPVVPKTMSQLLHESPQYLAQLLGQEKAIIPPSIAKAYAAMRGEVGAEEYPQMRPAVPTTMQHRVRSDAATFRLSLNPEPDRHRAHVLKYLFPEEHAQQEANQRANQRSAYLRARAAEEQRLQATPEQRDKHINATLRNMGLHPLTPGK